LTSSLIQTQGLPSGFIAEVVSDQNAISGVFASSPKTGDPLLLLVSKVGKVHAIEDPDSNFSKAKEILNLGGKMCTETERGLQSIAIHPDFTENRYVYLYYTKFKEGCLVDSDAPASKHPYNVVSRFVMDPDSLLLDFDSKVEIWRGAGLKGYAVHNGGAMVFGVDGKLYVTHGDGGVQDNAQDMSIVLGSIMRLNDDGSTPSDNPFTSANGYDAYHCRKSGGMVPINSTLDAVCSEIYNIGFRNPFRLAVDSNEKEKVRFSIQDVGARVWEELSYGGTDYAGMNYGWKPIEGPCLRHSSEDCPVPEDPNISEPFHYYLHRDDKSGCVSGAAFVPEGIWPEEYKFLFADFVWYTVYSLTEDSDNECRSCKPPISRFRNETFFETISYPGEHKNEAKIVDMFFGPYKDTQALYVIKYGNHDTVVRIRYTGIHDEPPIVNFTASKQFVDLNEQIQFDASASNDPEGKNISFRWFFGDSERSSKANPDSIEKSPSHSYGELGEYKVTLYVSDPLNQVQQKSMIIVVGEPPIATILSPAEGDKFYVGQVIHLSGSAKYLNGTAFEDAQLKWEVRKHHDDHWHPFLDPTFGNNIDLSPAPEPEDFYASTNSYLEVILYATDENGLTRTISQNVMPSLVKVGIDSKPAGLNIRVNGESVNTFSEIVAWEDQYLHLIAESDSSYRFVSWADGVEGYNRSIVLNHDDPGFTANYCVLNGAFCSDEVDCCSGFCHRETNKLLNTSGFSMEANHKDSKTGMVCGEDLFPTYVPTTSQEIFPTYMPTTSPATSHTTLHTAIPSKEVEHNPTDGEAEPNQKDKDLADDLSLTRPEIVSEASKNPHKHPILLLSSIAFSLFL